MSGLDHGQVLVDIIEDNNEIYPCELKSSFMIGNILFFRNAFRLDENADQNEIWNSFRFEPIE